MKIPTHAMPTTFSGVDPGLLVVRFKAGSDLDVGDVVYLSDVDEVDKSTTAGDYATIVGIVVGGDATYGNIVQADEDIGTLAAKDGEWVIVACWGVVKTFADDAIAAVGPVAAGTTTAGHAKPLDSSEYPLGIAMDIAGSAGDLIRVFVNPSLTPTS